MVVFRTTTVASALAPTLVVSLPAAAAAAAARRERVLVAKRHVQQNLLLQTCDVTGGGACQAHRGGVTLTLILTLTCQAHRDGATGVGRQHTSMHGSRCYWRLPREMSE